MIACWCSASVYFAPGLEKNILGSNTQVKNAIRVSPEKDYCSCKRLGYNFSSYTDVIFATSLIRGLVLRLHKLILASRYLDANSASSLIGGLVLRLHKLILASCYLDANSAASLIGGLVLRLHKLLLAIHYLDANSAASLIGGLVLRLHKLILASCYLDANSAASLIGGAAAAAPFHELFLLVGKISCLIIPCISQLLNYRSVKHHNRKKGK